MDKFKELVENRHEYARAWKRRTGGKVLGYFETYMPEEIVYAAGVLPVRILARHEPDNLSDKWIYASCYPVKDMVNQLLKGRYDYVDGLVNVEGCQWMFNAFEVAVNNRKDLFSHYLFLPDYTDAASSKDVLRSELDVYKKKIEEWTGKTVTDEALDHAIGVYNTNRRLLRRICELRRADRSVILGSEMMNIAFASQVMDKAEINAVLEKFIPELEDREPYKDRIRLMLIGSETHDARLEELVESLGGSVVIDELDNGTSYYWNDVNLQKDRLMALSLRYLGRPHNPVKDNNWRRRPQHIFELSEDYHIDGAIIAKQIYCHLHGTDNYAVWKILRERNIPFHFFERDTTLPLEETELRLEAFMNMLRPGLVRLAGWHKALEI
ncbi:MAG: 2-hydroxyacyl-CoA dehydratase [Peptococcaceae bacterium]|jgi:benzoyl-CoA reductase subunit C|nr:2-hydroxyacyl-CoA dehydratase [Peptococcaceae bacterium]